MKYTKNYNFKKPEPYDTRNINDINDSLDLVDAKLKETQDKNTNLNETFKQLTINAGSSNAEIVSARRDNINNKTYSSVPERLDGVASLLQQTSNQKADKTALEVESQRITNLAKLAQGSTTGDAELIDGRIGANGVVYETIGGSIREQVGNLKETLGNVNTLSSSHYIDTDFKTGTITGGIINDDSNVRIRTLEYKQCKGEKLFIKNKDGNKIAIHFYDDNYKFVFAKSFEEMGTISRTINMPESGYYMIVLAYANDRTVNTNAKILALINLFGLILYDEKDQTLIKMNTQADLFKLGSIHSESFVDVNADNRIVSRTYYKNCGKIYIKNTIKAKCAICFYNNDTTVISASLFLGFSKVPNTNVCIDTSGLGDYMRFVFAYSDDAIITDIANLLDGIELYDVSRDISKQYGITPKATINTGIPLSDVTIIKDKLYCFPYSTNDDHTVFSNGVIFELATGVKLGAFTGNIGHNNTVDYCDSNNCLIAGNGGNSTNIQPNQFYIFPNADKTTVFDVNADTTITYDVSKLGWGKQLNVVWGDPNRDKYDIVYCFTNYENGNMHSYNKNNVNNFTGDSRRYIRKVRLGKGTEQLSNGIFITGKSGIEFNGTFDVIAVYEREFVYDEANNGTQFYKGKLYETLLYHDSDFRYTEHSFVNYGTEIETNRKYFLSTGTGGEKEGMCIYNGIMYIGLGFTVYGFKID